MVLLVLIIIAVILAFFGSGWVPTIGAPYSLPRWI
jgi:hypothetical protein